jgi:dolichol kinase
MTHRIAKKAVHWLLVAVLLLYAITGLGITQYRIVEPATLGLLTKPVAFNIHDNLLVPLMVLLALHICQMLNNSCRRV